MESHLLQMRGLKPLMPASKRDMVVVASFTDAWIETYIFRLSSCYEKVASFTDAWIETDREPPSDF